MTEPATQASQPIKARAVASGSKGIAIVVDDDPIILELRQEFLQSIDYEVKTFINGKLALDFFTQGGKADLLLTDNEMPVMSGIELLRQLKAQNLMPALTILNTGRQSPELKAAVESLGAKFLPKPFSFEELKAVVEGVGLKR